MNKITIFCLMATIVAVTANPAGPAWRDHSRLRRETAPLEDENTKKLETEGKSEKNDLKTDSTFWFGHHGYQPYAYAYPYYGGYGSYGGYGRHGGYGYGYPYSYGPTYYHYYYY